MEEDLKVTFNKGVTILKENLKVRLEVISHADAQGWIMPIKFFQKNVLNQ
jgi:hypothetical protein